MTEDDINELNQLIISNLTIEAMEKFYAENVEMQDNTEPPRVGKLLCIEQERGLLNKVKSLKAELLNQAINLEKAVVFSEWIFDFEYHSGKKISLNEVSMQHWANGKIVKEKFFYKEFLVISA